ncbi:sigma 54-interacting transcriptional regulator [Flavonifractor sp. An82]|uniref:sigma 54-interacting transcriptional regulator n=1 Tax=Flavonifractor sp. An82 TaxID=1965660 RepID=UPI0019511A96|nr:sigma 54-interacting transcriptional regulator [Flavonifractor sp. An82]
MDELLEKAFDAAVIVDREGRFVYNTKGSLALRRMAPEEIAGKYYWEVNPDAKFHTTLESGRSQLGVVDVVEGRKCLVNIFPICCGSQVIGALSTVLFKNLTNLKQIIAKLPDAYGVEVDNYNTVSRLATSYTFADYIGESPAARDVVQQCRLAAQSMRPVLLIGETGTGKEILANAIHAEVNRRVWTPCIKINCSAILSAVMHADERNRAMSEALGQDVYHYHLHVVYVPVVEKQILWSKRCKDKSLVGTVKETIMQVSRSKKWESKVALDEQGNPLLTSKGKKVLRTSYSVLQDDFFNYMKAAGYTDVERGERGSTEEHLTVTQFKVAQEQQRLEDVTAQIAQTEQALDTAQAAVEKKQKELQSLQRQTKEQRTTALTVQEIRSMGKKTITGNVTFTPSECDTLKDYAVNGILAKAENSRLEEKLQSAQKSAAVWKQRYESLKEQARPYLEAVKLAPEKVRAFLDAILTRTRQIKQHDQLSRRKSQDMEL